MEEDHMSALTALGIPYPLTSQAPQIPQDLQALAAAVDALLTLPDEVIGSFGVQSISSAAATFASLPTPVTASITNPRSDKTLLCHVKWGGWLNPGAVEGRLGIIASGGNTWSAPTNSTNGPSIFGEQQLIIGPLGSGYVSLVGEFTMRVPAGQTTTLEVQGYRSATTNTVGSNYVHARITPLRYL
jgi:hypothetical protein